MNEFINVEHAAWALGVSKPTVYSLIRSGALTASAGPRGQLVSRSEVMTVATKRRVDAVHRHRDLVAYARQLRATIWPPEPAKVVLSDGREQVRDVDDVNRYMNTPKGRDALHRLDNDAVAVFGPAVIHTLADLKSLKTAGACAWCWSRDLAAVRGGISPSDNAATRVLLGEPCARDLAEWGANRDQVRALWADVKKDDLKRRADDDKTARRREVEAARADADRATRRLDLAITAAGTNRTAESARYLKEAARKRAAGHEDIARHLESVAARLERGAQR
ncbi:helix-turn-helix domain-containing protein [Streptomyces spinosisporus]|uniref:Helix-turn-helix domain-containing protein n=1 Tax=Streptomyces spinosisporus TaxID=2927582 RepID=A0ABS9X809_9ACTN|nr:helix-turn-helix domain-containing protein [Streptomyces spinosisporus]MCI3238211.1 helix-turn-helix domain-containing protein [Streptomyces spinosisporus]